MSGRFSLACFRRLSISFTSCALSTLSAPAFAQTVADPPQAPLAPTEPPVAPPAPDAPAPAPSEPAPPSQAPPIAEPTPAPTELKPTSDAVPAGDTPPAAAAPGSSAAFAPVADAPPKPQPKSPSSAAAPATAAAAASKSTPQPADTSSKDDDNSGGLLGPFRIGVLVGTGLPEIMNFGAQLKLTRFFGAGVNVGLIPTVKINYYGEAQQQYQEYDVYGHIYPFGGSFFLGAGVGYAQIDGILVSHFNLSALNAGVSGNVDVMGDATVRTLVLTPQLGFLKIFDVGFAIGFDVGAQIPIAPSQVDFHTTTVGLQPPYDNAVQTTFIDPNEAKVRHTLDTVGRTPLPTFNLKIGWFL
ncbi:MAG TPA: hypothetical protein VER96_11630 [Polyangiaceae bacterium]|nr:hypothetical protein [Polyangiaceae bacterium]